MLVGITQLWEQVSILLPLFEENSAGIVALAVHTLT